jgi:ABC-2 type transport system permease protein
MTKKSTLLSVSLTLGLLALNLIAFNTLLSGWSGARLDLTEDGMYSTSAATERILTSLDDNLLIRGYFSKRTHPKLAPLIPQIVDLLKEYQALSGGRLDVEILDPGEDELAEQEANARFGVTSTPFRLASKYETGIVNAYFNLVIQYGDQYEKYGFTELIQVDALPDGDIDVRLRNLEYDLTRAIKKVVYGFRSTAELFGRVDSPVQFTALVSAETLPEVFQEIPDAVRGAAEELGEKSEGKFTFQEIDPLAEASTPEQVYQLYGAQPMSLGLFGGDNFYLYGILQVDDRVEQIPLAGAEITQASIREAIEAALRRQTPGFLKTVGVVSPMAEIPPQMLAQYQMQGMPPPPQQPEFRQLQQFLGQDYTVQDISLDGAGVPPHVDVLVVIKPKNLSERAVYNLDQYLMRGGRLVLCVENYEAKITPNGLQVNPLTTGLDDWLAHHGVSILRDLVLDHRNQALPVPETRRTALGTLRTWRLAPYPYLVEVRDDGLVGEGIVAGLDTVGIYWGNPVEVDAEKAGDLEVTTILQSSKDSWTDNDLSKVQFVEYEVPQEGTRPITLAVALQGKFKSFYTDREIPAAPGAAAAAEEEPEGPGEAALQESPDTRVLVVGNAEFLSDFVAQALGNLDGGFFVENLRFLENSIDWMTLDNDMMEIRARTAAIRRLERSEKATEVAIETANYLIPTGLLLALAVARFLRRRSVTPVVGSRPAPGPAPGAAGKKEARA